MSHVQPTVGLVGAGTMGAGIAQVAAWAGHGVVLYDVAEAALIRGHERLARFLWRGAEKGRYSIRDAEAALARVTPSLNLGDLAPCAIVIEAAPEDLAIKRAVLAEVEAIVAPDAILATNTSGLSVTAIARGLVHPERVCGMHFFNPATHMKLVEVVSGATTATDVADRVAALAAAWGKTAVHTADTPGFIVNRVARPFYLEALRMLGEGVADATAMDRLVRDGGFALGPFELMDLIGIDVSHAVTWAVYDGFCGEPRFRPHPLQRAMVDSGRLGRKTGQGFYYYPDGES